MSGPRHPEAGFTLIETLIALAVLAIGATTLLVGVERHAAGTRALSDRIVARWVAENALAAHRLDLDLMPQWTRAQGTDWSVAMRARDLEGTALQAVTASVAPADAASGTSIVSLTGYIPRPGAAP